MGSGTVAMEGGGTYPCSVYSYGRSWLARTVCCPLRTDNEALVAGLPIGGRGANGTSGRLARIHCHALRRECVAEAANLRKVTLEVKDYRREVDGFLRWSTYFPWLTA